MRPDLRETDAEPHPTPDRDVFLSKVFTRGTTLVFLAISGIAAALALGYSPFWGASFR